MHVQDHFTTRHVGEFAAHIASDDTGNDAARARQVSQRRICRVLGQARATQRYVAVPRDGDEHLVRRLHELVQQHPRRGYRMMCGMLKLDGWRVNVKRVHRLWKREGFKVLRKQRKKRRLGNSSNGVVQLRATHRNHVWSVDFIHDRDDRDRPLKWLSCVDEFTRECVLLEVARGMTSDDVVDHLIAAFKQRGVPQHIRSDNGPEFIAHAITRLATITGITMLYIEPGSPWENGYAESFHSRLRDELLNAEVFDGVQDARALAAKWRHEYNHRRPHSSLKYLPPAVFAAGLQVSAPMQTMQQIEQTNTHCAELERRDAAPLPSQTRPSPPFPPQAQAATLKH